MKNIFAKHYYDASKIMHSKQLEGLELAGFNRRFWALFIDMILLVLILFLLGTILNYFGVIDFSLSVGVTNSDTFVQDKDFEYHAPELLTIILKLSIPVLYLGLITFFTNGYTFGKWILRIRIVATNHQHLSLWHSIERSLGYYASSLEFGFGFLQYFIDYNRRTVHDRIAETIVIKVKKNWKRNEIAIDDRS
jgi:uncharacterized RDD family membrane protein YckC